MSAPALVEIPSGSCFVGGTWLAVSGESLIEVIDPATEAVIARVPEASQATIAAAFAAARDVQPSWSAMAPEARGAVLDRLAEQIELHGEQLARLASSEIGMPIRDSRAGQVRFPVAVLKVYADLARDYPWEERDASGTTLRREAAGVVLAITPWNFPVHQIIAKIAPALVAGCTVVLKPSELTPMNALFIAELARRAGLPAGAFNVVTGTGPLAGQALLTSGAFDVVSFTGSLAVGRHVGATAGAAIVRATLELGGKSPALVAPDADLDIAVATTVRNCFVNAGQKCNAPTRLLVPEDQRQAAVEIALRTAREYVIGDPQDDDTTMGPVSSAAARDRIRGFVQRARDAGATVHDTASSLPSRGYFVSPTVITDVAQSSEVVQEEVFGPVLVIQGYTSLDEAVGLANDSPYGLSAEVWSADVGTVRALARTIRAGQVRVNGVRTPMPPVSPFGGMKNSGIGRELGPLGLEEFVEVKAILGDPQS